jgi:hypothetical protein
MENLGFGDEANKEQLVHASTPDTKGEWKIT